jgi:hypothetical protein
VGGWGGGVEIRVHLSLLLDSGNGQLYLATDLKLGTLNAEGREVNILRRAIQVTKFDMT